jgi:hypothetical protein
MEAVNGCMIALAEWISFLGRVISFLGRDIDRSRKRNKEIESNQRER